MKKEIQPKMEKKMLLGKYEIDEEGYVNFGDISRGEMDMQSQYGARYVHGELGDPNLGEGLRFKEDYGHYHSMKIHHEDVEEFIRRFKEYEEQR